MRSLTFGELVRNRRKLLGLSQCDVAFNMHVSAQYLSDIEKGRRNPPPDDILLRMVDALSLQREALLFHAAGRLHPVERGRTEELT